MKARIKAYLHENGDIVTFLFAVLIALAMFATGCKSISEVELVARVPGTPVYKCTIEGRVWYVCDGHMYQLPPSDTSRIRVIR